MLFRFKPPKKTKKTSHDLISTPQREGRILRVWKFPFWAPVTFQGQTVKLRGVPFEQRQQIVAGNKSPLSMWQVGSKFIKIQILTWVSPSKYHRWTGPCTKGKNTPRLIGPNPGSLIKDTMIGQTTSFHNLSSAVDSWDCSEVLDFFLRKCGSQST